MYPRNIRNGFVAQAEIVKITAREGAVIQNETSVSVDKIKIVSRGACGNDQ